VLYIGLFFVLIGLYSIFGDFFDCKALINEKTIVKNDDLIIDDYFILKAIVGIFAVIVGILSIINHLMY